MTQPTPSNPPSLVSRLASRWRRMVGGEDADASPATPTDWHADVDSPWATVAEPGRGVVCNICHWTGPRFEGTLHSESANCPQCGSISRDRFLFFCMQRRCEPTLGARLLETSPRMGNDYRDAMDTWFDYLCSDFDESAHRAMIKLDLQQIELDDASIDIILTPHVLEHVPETDKALAEIMRVLSPGGRMYLQVPVLQGRTAPPETPEFHGDNTPVFWRFGFDLTATLRQFGFTTALLTTEGFDQVVRAGQKAWDGDTSGEFDVDDMLAGVVPGDLEVVSTEADSSRHGFEPGYMFLTWECIKPA